MAVRKYDIDLFTSLNNEYSSKRLVAAARSFDAAARKTEGSTRANGLVKNFRKIQRTDLSGKRILEIGCGRGNTAFEIATQIGCEVVGIDIVQSPIWSEYKSPAVAFHKIDISTENYDFLGDFDFIYSFAVWEHIRHPFAALKAARALLRPHGAMYMYANLYRGPKASHRYREIFFPWPHLLFQDDVFVEYYRRLGKQGGAAAWVNKLVAAEYLQYFDTVGFEAKKVWYSITRIDEEFYRRFQDRLERYPKFDLERDFIHALLTPK